MTEFIAVTYRNRSDERCIEIIEKEGGLFLHIFGFLEPTQHAYFPIIRVVSTGTIREFDDGTATTINICEVENAKEVERLAFLETYVETEEYHLVYALPTEEELLRYDEDKEHEAL